MQNLTVVRNCETQLFLGLGVANPECLILFQRALLYLCAHADLCGYFKEQNEFLVNKINTYKIPQFWPLFRNELPFFSSLAVKKKGLHADLLPSAYLTLHYYYNNRSNSNKVNKNLIASTKNKSLWYLKDHSSSSTERKM